VYIGRVDTAMNFVNKIALITGVGRREGIGAAICRELAEQGYDIFFLLTGKAMICK